MGRTAVIRRKTTETEINLDLCLDTDIDAPQDIPAPIRTGIGFLDHMLTLFARHGRFGLRVSASGDREVDCHHTVEDTGIVLGSAIREALGDRQGICRYGHAVIPMDEALAMVTIDLGGRPYFFMDASFSGEKAGDMDTQMIGEFLRAVAFHGAMNLHVKILYGRNDHHMIEAIFKAMARALSEACRIDPDIRGVLSTKGTLAP